MQSILLLLMVMEGVYGDTFMRLFHPTGFNCESAMPGGAGVDPDLAMTMGQDIMLAAQYLVKDFVNLNFYICPNEIPDKLTEPWKFDCSNKVPVAISPKDSCSALLDFKMMIFKHVAFTSITLPLYVTCNRCGLMVEAEVKACQFCDTTASARYCSFISVSPIPYDLRKHGYASLRQTIPILKHSGRPHFSAY